MDLVSDLYARRPAPQSQVRSSHDNTDGNEHELNVHAEHPAIWHLWHARQSLGVKQRASVHFQDLRQTRQETLACLQPTNPLLVQ